ncbi:MAG TPA: CDP-glycerol glycerophosphotransferase family protein [Gaiellaceae bacterium]|nr:CDP-glycerol glycerophosphotransferase family protein [Gaiellaceae bacterium]
MQTHDIAIDRNRATDQADAGSERRFWLLLVDPLPNRIFFDCGIVDRLREALDDRLTAVWLVHKKHIRPWTDRAEGLPFLTQDDLMPVEVPFRERVARRVDIELDQRIGFFPLAVRHSKRNGFHEGRWVSGHRNFLLDPDRIGPLPRWELLEGPMAKWYFSQRLRYVPSVLLDRMRAECDGLIVTNLQARVSMPLMLAAQRLGLPAIGYVASWDHQVGKGVLPPGLSRYVVQNEVMRADLERYHGIDPARVDVTGWPQSDVYHRQSSQAEYAALVGRLGLDPAKPVVLYAGNTPTNQPYEANYVRRLVDWWSQGGRSERFQILFRPHPRDHEVKDRFAGAFDRPGLAVQDASYTDLADLATLLQHVAVVVANGGTILLDGVANDRPSICITFDAGAPPGERWADLNLGGEHYRELIESDALYRADDFEELFAAIERGLADPGEHAAERARVSREVMGEVDGRAVERVVASIVDGLGVRASA